MADGLGLTASIIAVLQITTSVASLSYQYLNSAIRAPDTLRELTLEFQTLIGILSRLEICAQDPQAVALRTVENSLHVCHKEMLGLQEKLKPRKNFLGRLRWPLDEKDIQGYLGRIERFKSSFSLALETEQLARTNLVADSIQKMEIEIENISNSQSCQAEREKDETRRDALNWLFPAPCDKRHIEVSSQRKKNTGQWIFKTREVQDWIKGNPSCRLLWGYGIPGAGKTFLSSLMIDHIEAINSNYGVGYVYFNFQEQGQQTPIDTISSLVKQLAFKAKVLPKAIEKAHKDNKRLMLDQLCEILLEIGNSFAQTFIIFDALDECDKVLQRETLLPMFHRIGKAGINLFLTSREHPDDIQESFANITKFRLWAKDDDISSYIEQRIADSARAKRLISQGNSELKGKIISALQQCANGMFLLVHFHIECLCQQTSLKQILTELERIKNSSNEEYPMDPTYHRAMENILMQQKSGVRLALKIISWLIKARRVLTVRELQLAVSVEEENIIFDEDSLPDRKTLLDVCASLVSIDETSDCVRFVHYTAQEFLTRNQIVPSDADLQVALACATFLSYDIFSHDSFSRNGVHEEGLCLAYPLLIYAAYELQYHLKQCDELQTVEVISRFVQREKNIHLYIRLATCQLDPWNPLWRDSIQCGELEVAAFLGNTSVVMRLLRQMKDVDSHYSTSHLNRSLLQAVEYRNLSNCQLLIENGAHTNVQNLEAETALCIAARNGDEAIFKLLIENGADINYKNKLGCTSLYEAARKYGLSMAKLLLENGADANIQDREGHTPLYHAVCRHDLSMLKLLLENGADANLQGRNGPTPLSQAVCRGKIESAKLLLENGADANTQNKSGYTPLSQAVWGGEIALAKLLLENGADANTHSPDGDTFLYVAMDKGNEAIVKLLLEYGADPNAENKSRSTALHLATGEGNEAMVILLLKHDANANAQDKSGNTPLYQAVSRSNKSLLESGASAKTQDPKVIIDLCRLAVPRDHEAIAKLLLENGADSNTQNELGSTALHLAADGGDEAIVKLLLETGADANAQDKSGNTALHLVRGRGEAIVKLLLENGADANTQNILGNTALHLAAGGGDEAIVKLLLETGADANTQNILGNTALHMAAGGGDEAIVKLLLETGADFNTQNQFGSTALHLAAGGGDEAIAKLLLETGADANTQNKFGNTALHLAASVGDEAVVKLLLAGGAYVNTCDKYGETALYMAIDVRNEAVVRLLFESGANINSKSLRGHTALYPTARGGFEVIVKLLLENGADVNTRDPQGDTVLYVAMDKGNEAIVKLLLEYGADPNAENKSGSTALHLAAGESNEAMVKVLLEYGADARAQGRFRLSPLNWAEINGNTVIIELLKSSINTQVQQPKTKENDDAA